jgi:hypothetical protein
MLVLGCGQRGPHRSRHYRRVAQPQGKGVHRASIPQSRPGIVFAGRSLMV